MKNSSSNAFLTDGIKELLKTVNFSEPGTTERIKEEATYMMFLELLYKCEGIALAYL